MIWLNSCDKNIPNRGKNNIPVIDNILSCLNGSLLFKPVIVVQMNGNPGTLFCDYFLATLLILLESCCPVNSF